LVALGKAQRTYSAVVWTFASLTIAGGAAELAHITAWRGEREARELIRMQQADSLVPGKIARPIGYAAVQCSAAKQNMLPVTKDTAALTASGPTQAANPCALEPPLGVCVKSYLRERIIGRANRAPRAV